MRFQLKLGAGLCVLAAAVTFTVAQQQNGQPTTKTTKTVTTTTTTSVKKVAVPVHHAKHVVKHARRRARRHYAARRRRYRYVTRVRRTVKVSISSTTTAAETGLVGLKLFDSGMKVLSMYGNPDLILNLGQAVPTSNAPAAGGPGGRNGGFGQGAGIGGGFRGPGGGGGIGGAFRPQGANGGPNFGSGERQGGNRPSGAPNLSKEMTGEDSQDWSFDDDTLVRQFGAAGGGLRGQGGGANFGPGPGAGGPAAGAFGPRGGLRGGIGGGFGGGVAGAGGGGGNATDNGESGSYMRWVYKRTASQYSFIIDRHDRVVQIEVTGMGDPKVRTNRGVTFGATFKELMNRYGVPDAYEISGDQLIMRYLTKNHVAFRLNRLQTDQPHEVTAIVVAGGRG